MSVISVLLVAFGMIAIVYGYARDGELTIHTVIFFILGQAMILEGLLLHNGTIGGDAGVMMASAAGSVFGLAIAEGLISLCKKIFRNSQKRYFGP